MTRTGKASDDQAFLDDVWRRLEEHRARQPENGMTQLDALTDFLQVLEQLGSEHAAAFRRGATQQTPGAIAEAVTWQMLRQLGAQVARYEVPGRGGPDFVAQLGGIDVLVESTSIEDETLQSITGLDPTLVGRMQTLGSSATAFRNRIKAKVRQISRTRFPGPRIVVVAYRGGNGAHDPSHVANEIIAEADRVLVAIGGGSESIRMATDLDASAWYQLAESERGFELARQSISAVLLMEIRNDHVWLGGSLNPHALHPLDPGCLPVVPWTKVVNNPIEERSFEVVTQWDDQRHHPILGDHAVCELWLDRDTPGRSLNVYNVPVPRTEGGQHA